MALKKIFIAAKDFRENDFVLSKNGEAFYMIIKIKKNCKCCECNKISGFIVKHLIPFETLTKYFYFYEIAGKRWVIRLI